MSDKNVLQSIADTIESRPVLGHWPHMRAMPDAKYLRALSRELADLTEERDGALGALARAARQIIAIVRLEKAIKWVLTDAAFKAPEEISDVSYRWLTCLRDALETPPTPAELEEARKIADRSDYRTLRIEQLPDRGVTIIEGTRYSNTLLITLGQGGIANGPFVIESRSDNTVVFRSIQRWPET